LNEVREESMDGQIWLLLIALVSGIVGAWDKIFSDETELGKKRRKRIIGLATIALLAASLVVQGCRYYRSEKSRRLLEEHTDNLFINVPEASGGVAIGDRAYLVDDEKTALFRADLDKDRYSRNTEEVELYDAWPIPKGEEPKGHVLTKKSDVNDLEGAAALQNKVYLITSHSNAKSESGPDARRQRFLEVELHSDGKGGEVGLVTRWADLRKSLEETLFQSQGADALAERFKDRLEMGATQETTTVMEIEGLAVDAGRNVYFGFRGPQKTKNSNALILRANLDRIFPGNKEDWAPKKGQSAKSSSPGYTVFEADIEGNKDCPRGIVDMVYYKNSLLILTNSAYKNRALPPTLWRWPIAEMGRGRNPTRLGSGDFYEPPENVPAKPEALLLPASQGVADKIFMFLDASGFGGGQRSYSKSQLGIP
jgi:hypothetical protein